MQSNSLNGSETHEKVTAPKRRNTKPSAPALAPKVKKATRPKKSKKSNVAEEHICQDISQDLSRTKPTLSGRKKLPAKTTSAPELGLPGQEAGSQLILGASDTHKNGEYVGLIGLTEKYDRPSGLGDKYQAAYNKGRSIWANLDASVDDRIASSSPTAAEDNVAVNDTASMIVGPSIDTRSLTQPEPWSDDGDMFADFVVPPSAQGNKLSEEAEALHRIEEVEYSTVNKAPPHDTFNSDEIFNDQDDPDDFPMEDESLEEIMQSIAPPAPAERNDLVDDWRPTFLDNGFFMEDIELTNDLPFLPNAIPHSNNPSAQAGSKRSANTKEGLIFSPSLDMHSSCVLNGISGNAINANSGLIQNLERSKNCFNNNKLDDKLIDMATDSSDIVQPSTSLTSPEKVTPPKLQWMPPKTYTPAKSSQIPVSLVDVPHLVPMNVNGEALPFMRPPFPKPLRDRSPIMGLSNRTVLRTCFRIGEALNAAAVASRSNTDAIVELYARIVSSEREDESGFKQFFQLGDLFTDKPPYLSATYGLWKGVGLWNLDSKVFLEKAGKGKLARVIGRIKRREQGGGCEMVIMSIWEVDWEDVGIAKGIVCS